MQLGIIGFLSSRATRSFFFRKALARSGAKRQGGGVQRTPPYTFAAGKTPIRARVKKQTNSWRISKSPLTRSEATYTMGKRDKLIKTLRLCESCVYLDSDYSYMKWTVLGSVITCYQSVHPRC